MLAAQLIGGQSREAGGSALSRLDAMLYDLRFQLLPPQRARDVPIVIVDLDEYTQQREGRWPWDRAKVADLLAAIQGRGAALIGLDMVFSEPGANPASLILDWPGASRQLRDELERLVPRFDGDAVLADAFGANVLPGYFLHAEGVISGALPAPFLQLPEGAGRLGELYRMPHYTGNLPRLAEQAPASGFITAVPDPDGIMRRVPLVMQHGTGVYASLTLEMARMALGAPWLRLVLDEKGAHPVVTGVRIGKDVTVPLDASGNMLVPYRGRAGSYPYLSATRLLREDASSQDLSRLSGAVVLVGTSALGLADLRTTPLQTAYPGVEAHANVLDTLLQAAMGRDTLYLRPDWEPGASLLALLACGLLLSLLLPGRSPQRMLLWSAVLLALVLGINFSLWHFGHLALPFGMLLILIIVLAGFNIAAGYLQTSRQKREIQTMFGQYVPAQYVEHMLAHPEQVSWVGEQKNMTVLFADIRNFTDLSESLSVAQLKDMLNRYLTVMTEVIFRHRGTIDKYVGDMIMAFWNAPLDDEAHAHNAVAAALGMQEHMGALRQEFRRLGLPAFDIGIGLSTGPMNVGDMGSEYRRAYTVLGDTVNLGARLEGVTRYYDVPVLVSAATARQAEAYLFRPVDLIRVKGRQEAIEVYQPLCLRDEAGAGLKHHVAQQELAVHYYRARRWPQARSIFQELLAADPSSSTLYSIYLDRMAHGGPPPPDLPWSGVHEHTSK